jgi:4-hydroxy-3-methylbut-2-enyl diphosphate reductase
MEVADQHRGPVVTLGPIIHNPQAVARFREKGVGTVGAISEIGDGTTVVVRTHGAVREEIEAAEERGLDVVDGTCPYVKYPQAVAQRLSREGYHVVIVGDANHAEIKGVVSYAEGPCTVVKPGGPVPEIDAKKVAVIAQTTCIGADFERVVGSLAARHKEVRAVNTICNDTEERQADARSLAREVDAVVVVGGKNSANTRHLAEICREIQPRTWHVETEDELRPGWFEGCNAVGLSAGASTPDWVVEGVAGWLRALR